MARNKENGQAERERLVSSAHLAAGAAGELSEFEFGLIIANHAFQRWIVRCMAAAGYPGLSPLDVLVFHRVNHRGSAKTLADICLVLNVEDTHTISYSLKKLEKLGLVRGARQGKEKTFTTTGEGRETCERYRDIREQCLLSSFQAFTHSESDIQTLASLIRALSGLYDQAARSAATL